MRINVTPEQLAACIQANQEALIHHIRDCGRSHPPADGTIGRIAANLEALAKMVATLPPREEPQPLSDTVSFLLPPYPRPADEIDVGATEKGDRVTVKRKIVEGRK